MKQLDSITLQRLKDNYRAGRTAIYLKMKINGEWAYITDADTEVDFAGATYYPGYIDDESIDDIESTSEPKTNDIGIEIDANENSFVPLFLNEGWMNGPVTIYEQHYDDLGLIFTSNVFEGLLDSRDLDPEERKILANITSVWADFDKEASSVTIRLTLLSIMLQRLKEKFIGGVKRLHLLHTVMTPQDRVPNFLIRSCHKWAF